MLLLSRLSVKLYVIKSFLKCVSGTKNPYFTEKRQFRPFRVGPLSMLLKWLILTQCVIYHMRHHYLAAAILGCVIHLTLYRAYNYFEIWATNNFILADLVFNKLARKLTL